MWVASRRLPTPGLVGSFKEGQGPQRAVEPAMIMMILLFVFESIDVLLLLKLVLFYEGDRMFGISITFKSCIIHSSF